MGVSTYCNFKISMCVEIIWDLKKITLQKNILMNGPPPSWHRDLKFGGFELKDTKALHL